MGFASVAGGEWGVAPPSELAHLPRLYCFANAGGSAEGFRQWQPRLADVVAVCPIELPGHGRRIGEPFCPTLMHGASVAASGIAATGPGPYFLFGHSLGSVLALETARALALIGHAPARCVFFSGRAAPHVEGGERRLHLAPASDLVAELRRLGGTPEELLTDGGFLDFFLPIVRDDYRLLELYTPRIQPKISPPVHVCCGDADQDAPPQLLRSWEDVSGGPCRTRLFSGGHFYVNTERDALLDYIKEICLSSV